MAFLKEQISKLLRENSFSKKNFDKWALKDFSDYEKKILSLQHFCDITPQNSDIIECGVGAGAGANLLSRISYSLNRTYYAYDTFSGFPDGNEKDNFFKSSSRDVFKYFSIEYIKDQLKNSNVSDEEINSINFKKGFFQDSLTQYNGIPGFVFIDVDLYESYKYCLKFFYPRLIKNGVILLDEYDSPKDIKKWPGAKIAIDEFCNQNKIKVMKHWTGASYLLKRS